MNSEFDFKNLSPEEIKSRCQQIARRKTALEEDLRRQENILRQNRTLSGKHRGEAQTQLEKLVIALLPDLSETSGARLKRMFTRNSELFRETHDKKTKGFWQRIIDFFKNLFGTAPLSQLEETRILLRNVLWQAKEIPPHAAGFDEMFRAFVVAKNNYFEQERLINRQEAEANQTTSEIKKLIVQLRRCDERIHSRQEEHRRNDDSSLYTETGDSDDAYFVDSGSSFASSSQTPTGTHQGLDASSANSSFGGFGGGGDFGGAGAGGSWENYS